MRAAELATQTWLMSQPPEVRESYLARQAATSRGPAAPPPASAANTSGALPGAAGRNQGAL